MKKQGMSQCRAPYRRHRIDPGAGGVVAVATVVGGSGAAVEVVVVVRIAAADEAVDYDAEVVATEQGKSQTWDWR